VAEIRVEIEEVCKNQAAVGELRQASSVASKCAILSARLISSPVKRCAKISPILRSNTVFRDAPEPFEKIAGGGGSQNPCVCVRVKPRLAASKGRANHAADVERVAEAPRDPAQLIEPVAAKNGFMRGDLQNRIRRRVADWRLGPNVLGAETCDDLGSRCMTIAENARKARPWRSKALGQLGAESKARFLENAPRAPGKAPRRFSQCRTAYPCQARASTPKPRARRAAWGA